jgi:hypothetical protein
MVHRRILIFVVIIALIIVFTIAVKACTLGEEPLEYTSDDCLTGHITLYDWTGEPLDGKCTMGLAYCKDCLGLIWKRNIISITPPIWTCVDEDEATWVPPASWTFGDSNGVPCKMRWGVACECCWPDCYSEGKWDASDGTCVICDSGKQIQYADCTNTQPGQCTATASNGDGQCESACGADSACDEVSPGGDADIESVCESKAGATAQTGWTCDSNCKCQESPSSLHLDVSVYEGAGTAYVYKWEDGSRNLLDSVTKSDGVVSVYFESGSDIEVVASPTADFLRFSGTWPSSWSCDKATCGTSIRRVYSISGNMRLHFSNSCDVCSSGQTRCYGNTRQSCSYVGGCWIWVNSQNCLTTATDSDGGNDPETQGTCQRGVCSGGSCGTSSNTDICLGDTQVCSGTPTLCEDLDIYDEYDCEMAYYMGLPCNWNGDCYTDISCEDLSNYYGECEDLYGYETGCTMSSADPTHNLLREYQPSGTSCLQTTFDCNSLGEFWTCQSGECFEQVCVPDGPNENCPVACDASQDCDCPHCDNGIQDCGELGIDCGGSCIESGSYWNSPSTCTPTPGSETLIEDCSLTTESSCNSYCTSNGYASGHLVWDDGYGSSYCFQDCCDFYGFCEYCGDPYYFADCYCVSNPVYHDGEVCETKDCPTDECCGTSLIDYPDDCTSVCPSGGGACPSSCGGSCTPTITDHCTNGKMDCDETGVDVGGSCGGACGDGILEGTEECESPFDSCCDSSTCMFKTSGTECRASAGVCDVAETCTGLSDSCPSNTFRSSSYECRPSAGVCDVAEYCTGSSAGCPTNSFLSSSTVCRAPVDVCDIAEYCTGSTTTCPSNAFRPSSYVCRSAGGVCDIDEYCTGTSATCPSNVFRPSGYDCGSCRECNGLGSCDYLCSGAETSCECIGDQCRGCSSWYGTACDYGVCDSIDKPVWECVSGSCSIQSCYEDPECYSPCTLTSVSVTPNCGIDGICQEGETITMTGDYTGNCAAADFFQIDASNYAGCDIAYLYEDMKGIYSTVSGGGADGGTFSATWNIPAIHSDCSGETVFATASALYDGGPPNEGGSQMYYTESVLGSFTLDCECSSGACCDGCDFEPAGTECRGAGPNPTCDPAEYCTGTSATCPADGLPSTDGTPCGTQNCDDECIGDVFYDYDDCTLVCNGGSCESSCACTDFTTDDCSDCSCTCGSFGEEESDAQDNCNDLIDNDCDSLTDTADPDCSLNSMNFTGNLSYSNGMAVSNSLIRFNITNETLGYNKIGFNQTNEMGEFFIEIGGIPPLLMNSDFDLSIYVVGEVEAIYECHYDKDTQECN